MEKGFRCVGVDEVKESASSSVNYFPGVKAGDCLGGAPHHILP
jgi:hypothetical protein